MWLARSGWRPGAGAWSSPPRSQPCALSTAGRGARPSGAGAQPRPCRAGRSAPPKYVAKICCHTHSRSPPLVHISWFPACASTPQACHAPALLLEGKPRLVGRWNCLSNAMRSAPHWARQWAQLSPAERADCMLVTPVTYSRLEFLVACNQVRGGGGPRAQGSGWWCGGWRAGL